MGKPILIAPPAPLAASREATNPEHVAAAVAIISTEDVQAALNRLGYRPVMVDGSYRPRTQQAVKAVQPKNGCKVDAWVGEETREAIIEILDFAFAAADAKAA